MREPPDVLVAHVERLKESYQCSKLLSLQDFETYWLWEGLTAVGRVVEAEELLHNYVELHRQCKWPLSARLAKHLEPANRGTREMRATDWESGATNAATDVLA